MYVEPLIEKRHLPVYNRTSKPLCVHLWYFIYLFPNIILNFICMYLNLIRTPEVGHYLNIVA